MNIFKKTLIVSCLLIFSIHILIIFAATNTWDFSMPADYTYDSAKLEVSDGVAKLKTDSTTEVGISKTVTASSVQGNNDAENSVDGSFATLWATDESTNSNPQWIMVDLGASYSISSVNLTYKEGFHAVRYQIQISETGFGDNWAVIAGEGQDGASVYASSSQNQTSNNASAAVDDDPKTTKWHTGEPTEIFPQNLEIDLGESRDIQKIDVIFNNNLYGVDFKFRVSDSKTGDNIAAGTTASASSNNGTADNVNDVDGDGVPKTSSTWTSSGDMPQWVMLDLGENKDVVYFEVHFQDERHATAYEFQVSTTTDTALPITWASGDVDQSSEKSPNTGDRAFDGNDSNLWKTNQKTNDAPQWVRVDMGSQKTVKKAEIDFVAGKHAEDYKLQYSDDDASYTNITSVTGNSDENKTHDFDITARYFRFYCTASQNGTKKDGLQVNEITLYSGLFEDGAQTITWDQTFTGNGDGNREMKFGHLASSAVNGRYVKLNMTTANDGNNIVIKNIILRETHFDEGPVADLVSVTGNSETELSFDSDDFTSVNKQYFQLYCTRSSANTSDQGLQVYELSIYPSDGDFEDGATSIVTIDGNTENPKTDVIDPPQTGRYVRLWVDESNDPGNNKGLQIEEFEIYTSTFYNGLGSVTTDYFQPNDNVDGWTTLVVDNNDSEANGTIEAFYDAYTSGGGATGFISLGNIASNGESFDLSSIVTVGDGIDKIRFRFDFSAGGDTAKTPVIDEIAVDYDVAAPDNDAPSDALNFTAAPGDSVVYLSWKNPSDIDFEGTVIRYRTDNYPASIADGLLVGDFKALPGTSGSFTHTGLTNGLTYYYTAFSYDGIPNYSDGSNTVAVLPLKAVHLTVSAGANQVAGVPFPVTITAIVGDEVKTDYFGTVNIAVEYVDPVTGRKLLSPLSVSGFQNGVAVVNVTYRDWGIIKINAVDANDPSISGVSDNISFKVHHLNVEIDNTADTKIVSELFDITVTAVDSDGNALPNFSGIAKLSFDLVSPETDQGGSLSSLTIESFKNGLGTLDGATYNRWGEINISAVLQGEEDVIGTSENIMFIPKDFLIDVLAPPDNRNFHYIDELFEISITAIDYNNAPIVNYKGSILLIASETVAIENKYTFVDEDNGKHTFKAYGIVEELFKLYAKDEDYPEKTLSSTPDLFIKFGQIVVISTEGIIGTLTVKVEIQDMDGNIIETDNSTVFLIIPEETNKNNSSKSDSYALEVAAQNGVAIIEVTNREGEKITLTPKSTPELEPVSGDVIFGVLGKSGLRILMWKETHKENF